MLRSFPLSAWWICNCPTQTALSALILYCWGQRLLESPVCFLVAQLSPQIKQLSRKIKTKSSFACGGGRWGLWGNKSQQLIWDVYLCNWKTGTALLMNEDLQCTCWFCARWADRFPRETIVPARAPQTFWVKRRLYCLHLCLIIMWDYLSTLSDAAQKWEEFSTSCDVLWS